MLNNIIEMHAHYTDSFYSAVLINQQPEEQAVELWIR